MWSAGKPFHAFMTLSTKVWPDIE